MELIIKKAGLEDIPAIHEITQEAFTKYAMDLGLPHKVSALQENYEIIKEEMKRKTILLAWLNGEPVGSVRYEIISNHIAYISRFGVRIHAQNCGVGRALIQAVEEQVKEKGVTLLALHSASKMTSLVRAYYGMGFYIHSTSTDRGYLRALFLKELSDQCETADVANII